MKVSCHDQIGHRIPQQCPGLGYRCNRPLTERNGLKNQHTVHSSRRCVHNEKIIRRRPPSWRRYPVFKGQSLQIAQAIRSQLLSHPCRRRTKDSQWRKIAAVEIEPQQGKAREINDMIRMMVSQENRIHLCRAHSL